MFEWVAEQRSALRGQYEAAVNATGPLSLTKLELLRLFLRKTMHDLRSATWNPLSIATLALLTIATLFTIDRLIAKFSSTGRKLKLPTLQMRKGWDYPTLLQQGARMYPNSPYIITYSGYEYVVFPSSAFDEIKKLNASRASMVDWFTQVFWQGWHFLGTDNSARYHMVSIDLARALPSRVWMRQDNAQQAFEAVLGPTGVRHDWTALSLWGTVQKIISLMNATGLLGPELGLDPRWLKATERLHNAIIVGIVGSHLTPRLLRPLVAPVVFLPARLVDWHMSSLLRPILQKEMERFQEKGSSQDKEKDTTAVPDLALHPKPSKEKFPLTSWLLDRYRSGDKNLAQLVRDHIVVAFEAATTSAGMLYFLLAELAVRPDLVQELREELSQNMDAEGHLPLGYLAELRKMDSFMLESARVTGSSHLALFRRVQKPLKLSLGPELAPGTLICVDAFHISKSQTRYEDASELKPLRFYEMRQQPNQEDMHQFTQPGPDNTIWGGGTQACPGRLFGSVTIKVALAHFLLNYDVQLLPNGESAPKRNSMPNGSISPDTKAKIMVRERNCA